MREPVYNRRMAAARKPSAPESKKPAAVKKELRARSTKPVAPKPRAPAEAAKAHGPRADHGKPIAQMIASSPHRAVLETLRDQLQP